MKILLVDDDAFLRDMYAIKFTESGHTVSVAESPANALTVLQSDSSFDLILLDMIMPGMTGTDLITEIKKQHPTLTAKIVMLSNQSQNEDIEEATTAGAVGYIVKAESIPSEVVKKAELIINKR